MQTRGCSRRSSVAEGAPLTPHAPRPQWQFRRMSASISTSEAVSALQLQRLVDTVRRATCNRKA